MAKLIYRCDCCNKAIKRDIILKIEEDNVQGFLGNLMLNNGFYPEIDRFVVHNCSSNQKGIARLSGISLGEED